MNMFRFAARFLIAFALAIPAAHAQTPQSYNTLPSIAALKAMTNRPQVVEVVDANPGVFNLSTGACSAADDVFQVQPTSGTTVCYTRMATSYSAGKGSAVSVVAKGALCDGTTDDSAAFNSALTSGRYVTVPAGAVCVVKDVIVDTTRTLDCQGASLQAAAGAKNIVKGTGFGASVTNCQFNDTANATMASNTTSGTASVGNTVISMTGTTGFSVGAPVVLTLDSGARHVSRLDGVAANSITLRDAVPASATSAAVAAGGSGYTVGDILTVQGGTGVPTTVRVATLSVTAVATVTVAAPGLYSAAPGAAAATAGGTGSGATITLTTSGAASGATVETAGGALLLEDAQYFTAFNLRFIAVPTAIQMKTTAAPAYVTANYSINTAFGDSIRLVGIFRDKNTSNGFYQNITLYGKFSSPAFGATGIYIDSRDSTFANGGDQFHGVNLLQWQTAVHARASLYTRFVALVTDNTRNYGAILDGGGSNTFGGGTWLQYSGPSVLSLTPNGGMGAVLVNASVANKFESLDTANNGGSDLYVDATSEASINTATWGPSRGFSGTTSQVNFGPNCIGGVIGPAGGCSLRTVVPPANGDGLTVQGFGAGTGAQIAATSSAANAPIYLGSKGVECVYTHAPAGSLRLSVCPTGITAAVPFNGSDVTGTGTVRGNTGFSANGTAGLSVTKTVRDSAGTGTCTLIFSMGLLTGGTC